MSEMWFYTSAKLSTIRLLVSRSKPWSTILRRVITIKPWYDGTEAVGTHNESDREYETTKDLDNSGIRSCQTCRATTNNKIKETAEGQHNTRKDLIARLRC